MKTYPNKFTAIKNVSCFVPKRGIFGLLGPNGAGQSTTFNIASARIQASSGKVEINNQEVNQFTDNIWTSVGLCPQTDCLWQFLTPLDHLQIFSQFKGLHGENRDQVVNYFLDILQLRPYANKQAKHLSGGNRRQLSVALALIGNPDVQYFDEPSSGLDPIAKRFLWQTLRENLQRRDASIILTTHSMNEAESLCNKIGILINGVFACVGSPEHLSQKYGNGFRLSLNYNEA